jgi:hypothetical protein
LIEQVENAGGLLALNGERLRVRLPEDAASLPDGLQARKAALLFLLPRRDEIPSMLSAVRLLCCEPKSAHVVLTSHAVATDVYRFTSMTLLQLTAALTGKQLPAGHRRPRGLVNWLGKCGVLVAISDPEQLDATHWKIPTLGLRLESLSCA